MPFETDRFRLEHFSLTKKEVDKARLMAAFRGGSAYAEVYTLKPGKYAKLVDKKFHEIVMSDTPMELETNAEFISAARGSVMIGGLGLGLVLLAIQKKPEVTRILVVEKEQELIERISRQLPLNSKVEVVQGDILSFETKEKFDTLYFDIWNNICGDNWNDMKKLHARYRKNKAPGAWMDSWRSKHCKRLLRQDY